MRFRIGDRVREYVGGPEDWIVVDVDGEKVTISRRVNSNVVERECSRLSLSLVEAGKI